MKVYKTSIQELEDKGDRLTFRHQQLQLHAIDKTVRRFDVINCKTNTLQCTNLNNHIYILTISNVKCHI